MSIKELMREVERSGAGEWLSTGGVACVNEASADAFNKWEGLRSVSEQLPVGVSVEFGLEAFIGKCHHCEKDIDGENMRGEFSRLTSKAICFNGMGMCDGCMVLTPFTARVREIGGGLQIEHQLGERWVRFGLEPERKSLAARIERWFRGLCFALK